MSPESRWRAMRSPQLRDSPLHRPGGIPSRQPFRSFPGNRGDGVCDIPELPVRPSLARHGHKHAVIAVNHPDIMHHKLAVDGNRSDRPHSPFTSDPAESNIRNFQPSSPPISRDDVLHIFHMDGVFPASYCQEFVKNHEFFTRATASISTDTSLGSRETSTQARAGRNSPKNRA